MRHQPAIDLLESAAAELAQISLPEPGPANDGAHLKWMRRLYKLQQLEPFREFSDIWINTGDGSGVAATPQFEIWVAQRLFKKKTPKSILAAFAAEVERNAATYTDASALLGVQIDASYDLGDGITLVPGLQGMPAAAGVSFLCQSYLVRPAFQRRSLDESAEDVSSVTTPNASRRGEVRKLVRLACLLASDGGAVELSLPVQRRDPTALFVADKSGAGRPFVRSPLECFPVEAAAVMRAFQLLGRFQGGESLARAIDRLSRARLAASPVDRALELGIAAEIALMHDKGADNSEITHKISSRAAWLLGRDSSEREAVFREMKALYGARSRAVHRGEFSSKSILDLAAADRLVTRALTSILERGRFPNWDSLTMGGDG
ncbi:HEPN domain-containing protein [Methylocystis sp.]|uniref:HEPN domain-containing protein n=1 Tax=Methylocystis sp. TaxID=1911079 RepID=UPI002735F840|nr:HEPN domain-containing protein [Methylocystis sp.]MDP3553077.1 HEPN domain-containing protein [Methylocystis sp.]